jgi:hypothetical protein
MEKDILKPNGDVYMTAVFNRGRIEFRNFGNDKVNIMFDARVLDQLIPFLTEANFWNKVTEKQNETSN